MNSMESLDRLQAELSGNVYGDAFYTLYKLSQDVSVEHSELMAQAMKWVHKEKVEPLEAENAKLRMLIDLKQTCWKYVGWCSECPHNGLDDEHDDCNCTVREKVNSLARELGIEVDDGNET